jgi:hypothetical protein
MKQRFAENVEGPRPPLSHATLTDNYENGFVTIGRLLFTTETNWDILREKTKDKDIKLNCTHPSDAVMISIGITGFHPNERAHTANFDHLAVLKITENKYLTLTRFYQGDIRGLLNQNIIHHAPKFDSHFYYYRKSLNENFYDQLLHYQTIHNTFFYWNHSNIKGDINDNSMMYSSPEGIGYAIENNIRISRFFHMKHLM